MSLKKIRLLCELLTEQMNHWMLFPIALTMMEMTRGQTGMEKPDMLLWILCSLFPLLFFVLRVRHGGKKRYLFLLWHIAAAAAYTLVLLLVPRPFICRGICVLCGAGYMLHSLILHLKREALYTAAIQLPAGVALSLVSTMMRHTNHWNHYYTFSLIAVIAAFFIAFYMRQYLDYISLNAGSTGHLPVGEIFRSGAGLVTAYTLFGTVLLMISVQYEWLARALKPAADFLVQFLRFLLSKIFPKGGAAQEDMTIWEEGGTGIGSPQLPAPKETFWFWSVLEFLFTVALIGGLIYLAARILLRLFALLQEYLNRRMAGQSPQDQEVFDVRERCDAGKTAPGRRQRKGLSEALTNRERIRRLYKRKLLAFERRLPEQEREDRYRLGLHTAREWEMRMQTRGMARIYELARYSENDVTADDVRQMREACSEREPNAVKK